NMRRRLLRFASAAALLQQRACRALGTCEALPSLVDAADDRSAQPLTENRRERPLEAGAGLEQAGEGFVIALHRGRRQLRLERGDPGGPGRLVGLFVHRVQPELALAQSAPQVALGELQ